MFVGARQIEAQTHPRRFLCDTALMRIGGGSGAITAQAGMSALWHDPDIELERQAIHIPTVEKNLDGMALPSEQHQLPEEAKSDPYAKQEAAFDVAAADMERGLRGQNFLNGKAAPAKHHDIVAQNRPLEVSDPKAPTRVMAMQEHQAANQQIEKAESAGRAQPKVSNATSSATARKNSEMAQKTLEMAESLGIGMAGMIATQGIDPTSAAGQVLAESAGIVKAITAARLGVGAASNISKARTSDRAEQLAAKRRLKLDE